MKHVDTPFTNTLKITLLLFAFLLPGLSQATEQAFEDRWSRLLADQVVDGEIVWLSHAKGKRFLSIYSKPASAPKGAVILMHGMRRHANWQEIIEPLRSALPDQGWATLSLQMPVKGYNNGMRDHSELLNESPVRINAAIQFLRAKGYKRIVLLGDGLGAVMGLAYLIETPNAGVDGLVGVGMYMLNYTDPRMWTPDLLEKFRLPMLDIYGEHDEYGVANSDFVRANAARKANNKAYTQIKVKKANHDFANHSDILIKSVSKWLNGLVR